MSYALCEFKIPVKISLSGVDLTARSTKDIALTLHSFLNQNQAELVNVTQYVGELDNLDYDSDNREQAGTYFVVSIQLDNHQRQDWKIFDALIIENVLDELASDDLHISTYSETERESFIAFVKDYD